MLSIEVYMNGRVIGRADAQNASDEGPANSDYICCSSSKASPITGTPAQNHGFRIEGHDRNQSAWALVAKIAGEIAEREARAG